MRLRALSYLLSLAVAACAPASRPTTGPQPALRHKPRLEEAIRATRARFYRGGEAGDVGTMALAFTEAGMLITGRGDTIRGRAAVANYFSTTVSAPAGATFRFDREPPLQDCTFGAYERGWYWAEVRYADHAPDTLSGRFLFRWVQDSLGDALIDWATLSRQAPEWPPPRSRCVDPAVAFQASTHLTVTMTLGGSVVGTGPQAGVESVMINHGWNDPTFDHGQPTPQSSTRNQVNLVGGLRYRFRKWLAAELTIGTLPQGTTLGANYSRSENLWISWSGLFAGALVSYERGGLQLGAGPGVQRANWRADSQGGFGNRQFRFRSSSVGLVADVGFHHAMVGRLRLDLRAQVRRFTTTTPTTENLTPVRVAFNSSYLGVGFGVVF